MIVGAVHKVRHGIFLANFDPPFPVTFCHTSLDPPKVRHTSRTTRRFLVGLVQKSRTNVPCTNSVSIVRGGFVGEFCPGWFLSVSPSFTIHLLQQKVKHHFKFYVSYRLYRAQRLYVQLLSKSMLL